MQDYAYTIVCIGKKKNVITENTSLCLYNLAHRKEEKHYNREHCIIQYMENTNGAINVK